MTDSGIKYVGVDGCTAGWIGVGLDDGDGWEVKACVDFSDVLQHFVGACVVLVDIPIGLLEEATQGGRDCDREARRLLPTGLKGSVFPAPPRRRMNEVMNEQNPTLGGGINQQIIGIIPKIDEVGEYLEACVTDAPKIREIHPEVCFWALNGGKPDSAMTTSKKNDSGFNERIQTLRHCARHVNDMDVDAIYSTARRKYTKGQVANDDILDALAAAITAKIGSQNDSLQTLPENPPTDSKGLPMEMVYAIPNEK